VAPREKNTQRECHVYKKTAKTHKNILPGIGIKTVAYGDKTLMAEFSMERGAKLPEHSHVYEQTGYLVYGSMVLPIGDVKFEAVPGVR
jgi:quercetin dioxygenase-like cupin family protein